MPRKRESRATFANWLLDITAQLRTGPCVPALRGAVKAWKAGGYKGITDTSRILLDHRSIPTIDFQQACRLSITLSQQEAIETLLFVWEFEKSHTRKGLLERYAQTSGPSTPPV